jgi:FKBP-type peptidyl-prolyl cis-trans isomerase 2
MTNTPPSGEFKITPAKSYVKIKYKVQIAGGAVLKGAEEPEIMDFVTGYLQVVPGLEKRLLGHGTGEKLSFTVPADEAFGERVKELVLEKDKEDFYFPGDFYPYPGMELPLVVKGAEGPDTAIIREVKEKTIVLDLNHPLSGAALKYDLEIIEARPAKETDVCSEWDSPSEGEAACPAIPQVVLGKEDPVN